ncbi:MAG: HAMP domain-containing sensor histidine kinase [Propionibacteriales bacterium]|nr:HAMP domain-containing sensor histidine kinase [Propionibacteriales bacterium]
MRRRLLVLSVSLAVTVLVLLTVPLLRSYAESRAVDLHQQRLAAATRFAALADDGSSGVRLPDLKGDLTRFDDVVGSTRTWVVGTDGSVVGAGGSPLPGDVPGLSAAVRAALAGTPTTAPGPLWPWAGDDLVVATPVGRDAQVLGAVVMVEDTAGPRADVARVMGLVALGALLFVVLLGWLVGVPLVRWIVRPVEQLEDRVHALGRGRASTVGRVEGPPELRRLVQAFNEMVEDVEQARRQQRDLVADVSHQLANPLTAIRLRLEHLAREDESVVPVLAETERMAQSLEDVIAISRVGSLDREPVAVDVAAQVRGRVELWQPLFGTHLRAAVPDGVVPAVLEEDLVPTVVDVLLDNAAKYAPDADVEVELTHDEGAVRLLVRDRGAGVTPEEAAEVGRRFHRLDRHADVAGTGLGLSILELRVRDAGGSTRRWAARPGLAVEVTLPGRADAAGTPPRPGAAGSAG